MSITLRGRPMGRWILTSYEGLEGKVEFPALDCAIPMGEVFANVEFPASKVPRDQPADQ